MNYSKQAKADAWKVLEQFRHCALLANVTHVSRSGMSRRMRFTVAYTAVDGTAQMMDITYLIARIIDANMNDSGLRMDGCGMDMCFAAINNFNYYAAQHDLDAIQPGLSWNTKEGRKLLKLKESDHIYDHYFFDADRI